MTTNGDRSGAARAFAHPPESQPDTLHRAGDHGLTVAVMLTEKVQITGTVAREDVGVDVEQGGHGRARAKPYSCTLTAAGWR